MICRLLHCILCHLWSIWRCVPRAVVQSLMTSCSAMAGWRKCNPHQHSTLPPRAASVSDELCCSADVFFMVRSRPSTAALNALVEDLWRQLILSSLSLPLQQHCHTLPRNLTDVIYNLHCHCRCMWLSTISDWAFPVTTACVWKGLPLHVMYASSLLVFRRRLKTRHLFMCCFHHFNSFVVPEKWYSQCQTRYWFLLLTYTVNRKSAPKCFIVSSTKLSQFW